jgi:hypothetical protein
MCSKCGTAFVECLDAIKQARHKLSVEELSWDEFHKAERLAWGKYHEARRANHPAEERAT